MCRSTATSCGVDTMQNAFVKSVHSCINQLGCDFLPILNNILPTCSKDIFSKYDLFWIIYATKVLENLHNHVRFGCKVLGVLVEQCKKIPELHKQISMQHMKQLINILSLLQPDVKYGAVYYLLAVLLYYYSKVCERFKELIKNGYYYKLIAHKRIWLTLVRDVIFFYSKRQYSHLNHHHLNPYILQQHTTKYYFVRTCML